jgi:hypothetical protein
MWHFELVNKHSSSSSSSSNNNNNTVQIDPDSCWLMF